MIEKEYISSLRQIIGEWLKTIREEKNLSQRELGEMCGMTHTTISKIEAGKWSFGIDTLILLLVKLDCYLFLIPKESQDDLATEMRNRWKRANDSN